MRWVAVAIWLCAGGIAPAQAEQSIPTQDRWHDARQVVTTTDGINLAYIQLATGDGMPLILLHGYTDNSRSWSLPAPWLGDDRPIYAVDLRGHGASDMPACCYGLDSLAHDLGTFMDAMEIQKADIVGHSLGSMAAAVFAATEPERVNRLVLVSSSLYLPAGAGGWLWDNVPTITFPTDPDSQFMLDWYYSPNPVDDDFLTRERAESASRPRHVWMGVLAGLTMANWTALAPRITAPTMILWGDQDGFFGADEQAALKAALPDARYETFAGFGHNIFWEKPQDAAEMIAGFLSE